MARSRLLLGSLGFLVVAAGLLAGPASADLLVTRDGETVETRGEWEVRGKVVHFTGMDGRLRLLRVVDLDLEESERRTREAAEMRSLQESQSAAAGEEASEPARRKAVLVLTDADVRHVRAAAAGGDSASSGEEAEEARGDGDRRAALRVSAWSESLGADGLEIRGTLQNDSDGMVAGISMEVDVLGEDGNVVESVVARVDRLSLAAGESSRFTASPRSFFLAREPDFRPHGLLLAPAQPDGDSSPEPAAEVP